MSASVCGVAISNSIVTDRRNLEGATVVCSRPATTHNLQSAPSIWWRRIFVTATPEGRARSGGFLPGHSCHQTSILNSAHNSSAISDHVRNDTFRIADAEFAGHQPG